MQSPEIPRCVAYMDMQWFLRTSKFMFDVKLPNFNPRKLAEHICRAHGWSCVGAKAYLDTPDDELSERWARLWMLRAEDLEAQNVKMWVTPQRNRQALGIYEDGVNKVVIRSDIEVTLRMSLDILADVIQDHADVVILFSKENKYIELIERLKMHARESNKYLKIVTAYPYAEGRGKGGHAGIDCTDWNPISRTVYDACTDYIRKPHAEVSNLQKNSSYYPSETEVAVSQAQDEANVRAENARQGREDSKGVAESED